MVLGTDGQTVGACVLVCVRIRSCYPLFGCNKVVMSHWCACCPHVNGDCALYVRFIYGTVGVILALDELCRVGSGGLLSRCVCIGVCLNLYCCVFAFATVIIRVRCNMRS